ncbi:unnamed protein product [Lota lota]
MPQHRAKVNEGWFMGHVKCSTLVSTTYPGQGYLYSMVLISSNTSVTIGPSKPPAAQQTIHQSPRDPESYKDTT